MSVNIKKKCLASAVAFACGAMGANVLAQELEEVVVTGYKKSLQDARSLKREARGVVDAIAAEDLGKLPDQNVAESLQRISGVAIERNLGDGQKITVRGLGPIFNAVTVNGRLVTSDEQAREFNFDVLPSEIITGASVYKSPLANINGASIGATIDLKTTRPFDLDPFVASATVQAALNDLADEWDPTVSGVVSYTNDEGTFGVSVAASIINRAVQVHRVSDNGGRRRNGNLPGERFDGRSGPGVPLFTDTNIDGFIAQTVFTNEIERAGLSAAIQFAPTENSVLTVDLLHSGFDESRFERAYNFDIDAGTITSIDIEGGAVEQRMVDGVMQDVIVGGEVVQRTFENATTDHVVWDIPRLSDTNLIGINYEWEQGNFIGAVDVYYSETELRGNTSRIQSTARRNGVTHSVDFRNGGPVADIQVFADGQPGTSNEAFLNSPSGIGAHWQAPGGDNVNDEAFHVNFDGSYDSGDSSVVSFGVGYQGREKSIDAIGRDLLDNCQFCFGTFILPESLFTTTDFNFLGGEGNLVNDFATWQPVDLVNHLIANFDGNATGGGFLEIQDGWNDPFPLPTQTASVEEDILTAYVMGDFDVELAGMPLSVNLGLRFEDTDYTSTGGGQEILSAFFGDRGDGIEVTVAELGPVEFLSLDAGYRDFLPSANLRLEIRDDLVARMAYSRVVTRPALDDLTINQIVSGTASALAPNVRRGNADLLPYRATQIEIGLEWYYGDINTASVAIFAKDLDSFISDVTSIQRIDRADFDVTQPENGEGAEIEGIELAVQHVFDNGFGVQANFTHVKSDADFGDIDSGVSFSLEGLSENSYNIIGFYTRGDFEGRIAYNVRDEFLVNAFGRAGNPEVFDEYKQIDASISYQVTDSMQLTLSGINLTDERELIFNGENGFTQEYRQTGRRIVAGLRMNF